MSKIENVKKHLRNNKTAYITAGTVVVIAGVAYYAGVRVGKTAAASIEYVGDTVIHNESSISGISYKPTINNIVQFAEDSTPSRPVGLVDDNGALVSAFKSIGEAARQTGLTKIQVSKVVNGLAEKAEGMAFVALDQQAA